MTNAAATIKLRVGEMYTQIENAGTGIKGQSRATFDWLEAHRKFFDTLRISPVATAHAIRNERLPKFMLYCKENGVNIIRD